MCRTLPAPSTAGSGLVTSSLAASAALRQDSGGSHTVPELTEDTRRVLRQTRSLFLCSRGLRSLRHIRHLELMTGLRSLCVHMNGVRRIEGLASLRNLVELDLSANELTALDADCFQSLHSLRRLNLSSNFLSTLGDAAAWRPLRSLEWVSVGFNALVDICALRGIPDVAPLFYVDLCGNRIARIEQVEEALALQRPHLQELRLETPKAMAALMLAESADLVDALTSNPIPIIASTAAATRMTAAAVDVVASDDAASADAERVDEDAVSSAAVLPLLLRENPCCVRASPASPPDSQGNAGPHEPRGYAERLLEYFPRLTVLNGVSYALDPLQPTAPPLLQHMAADEAAEGAQSALVVSPAAKAARREESAAARQAREGRGEGALVGTPAARVVLMPPHTETSGRRSQATRRLSFALDKSAARSPAGRTECSHSPQHLSSAPYSEPESGNFTTSSSSSSNSGNSSSTNSSSDDDHTHRSQPRVERHARSDKDATHEQADATKANSGAAEGEKGSHSVAAAAGDGGGTQRDSISATQLEQGLAPLYTPPRPYVVTAMPHAAQRDAPGGAADTTAARGTPPRDQSAPEAAAHCEKARVEAVDPAVAATLAMVRAGQPVRSLKWRPQRVSRGTSTSSPDASRSEDGREAAALRAERGVHRTQLARVQEQLSLRLAIEADLRRHLSLAQRRRDEVEKEARLQACHARAQVTALKDELTRRALEAAILHKKYHAELAEQRRQWAAQAATEQQAAVAPVQDELAHVRRVLQDARAAHERQMQALQSQHDAELRASQARYERSMRAAAEEQARDAARARTAAQQAGALFSLQLAEAHARAALQAQALGYVTHDEAEASPLSCYASWCATALRLMRASLRQQCAELETRCEARCATLQENYRTALEHAEREIERLRQDLSARGTSPPPPRNHEPPRADERTRCEQAVQTEADSATFVAADETTNEEAEAQPHCVQYWRRACHAREVELKQMRQACRVATDTQRVVAQENSRLLQRITEAAREATAQRAALVEAAAKEKETLLRTLHNLEASLATKDDALDTLEAEARAKLDEKRHRIAELEQQAEAMRDELAACQRECAAARAAVGQAEQTARELRQRLAAAEARDTAPDLSAVAALKEQQYQQAVTQAAEDKQRVVSALRVAREQLVRLHASHATLLRVRDEYKAQLAEKEAKLTALTQQLQEVQTSARVKQRATLEAFSRFIMADAAPEA